MMLFEGLQIELHPYKTYPCLGKFHSFHLEIVQSLIEGSLYVLVIE